MIGNELATSNDAVFWASLRLPKLADANFINTETVKPCQKSTHLSRLCSEIAK